jgi:hypothetical protein
VYKIFYIHINTNIKIGSDTIQDPENFISYKSDGTTYIQYIYMNEKGDKSFDYIIKVIENEIVQSISISDVNYGNKVLRNIEK